MDNYFKVGDKWAKVAPDMTSVKLGTCIHIVCTYFIFLSFLPSGVIHSSIPWSFTHAMSYPPYLHVIVSEFVPITIPFCIPSYLVSWTKEAGCQAHGILKRWVARPVRNSPSERIVGNWFPEGAKLQLQGSETSCPADCWSSGREFGQPRDCWAEKRHTS